VSTPCLPILALWRVCGERSLRCPSPGEQRRAQRPPGLEVGPRARVHAQPRHRCPLHARRSRPTGRVDHHGLRSSARHRARGTPCRGWSSARADRAVRPSSRGKPAQPAPASRGGRANPGHARLEERIGNDHRSRGAPLPRRDKSNSRSNSKSHGKSDRSGRQTRKGRASIGLIHSLISHRTVRADFVSGPRNDRPHDSSQTVPTSRAGRRRGAPRVRPLARSPRELAPDPSGHRSHGRRSVG
jgi:hypothetical protein